MWDDLMFRIYTGLWNVGTKDSFYANFGLESIVLTHIYYLYLRNSVSNIQHLLMTLEYLKCYPLTRVASVKWGYNRKTYIKHIKNTLDILDSYLPLEFDVYKQQNPRSGIFVNVIGVVDGTELRIKRPPKTVQRLYYSGKKKCHTIKYQVVTDVVNGFFLDIYGPFFGTINDSPIFEEWYASHGHGLLRTGELLLGDKAYIKFKEQCVCPIKKPRNGELSFNETHYNRVVGAARCIIEQSFSRLKKFSVLSSVYRGTLSDHEQLFRVCSKLVNFDIQHRPLRKNNKVLFV